MFKMSATKFAILAAFGAGALVGSFSQPQAAHAASATDSHSTHPLTTYTINDSSTMSALNNADYYLQQAQNYLSGTNNNLSAACSQIYYTDLPPGFASLCQDWPHYNSGVYSQLWNERNLINAYVQDIRRTEACLAGPC